MAYAEVVVNVPLQHRFRRGAARPGTWDARASLTQTFHYAIPTELRGKVGPGHLVQVPFGKQDVQGIVVALSEESPVAETRYLSALLDDSPVISDAQIELGRWISHYYLAPLFSALQLMLPPGLEQRSQLTVTWRGEGPLPPDLSPAAQKIAVLLREKTELRSGQFNRRFPEGVWRKAVDELAVRGLVTSGARLTEPRARIRMEGTVRTLAQDPRQALLGSTLGLRSKGAALLHRLWQSADPLPSLHDLCDAVGCSVSTAKTLEKRGLITIRPARTLVRLAPGVRGAAEPMDKIGAAGERRIMERLLRDPGAPIDASCLCSEVGASFSHLAALQERGMLLVIEEPKAVALACPRDKVEDHLLELRRLERYLSVLEFLSKKEEPVWVGVVYAETGADSSILKHLAEAGLVALDEQEHLRDPLADLEYAIDVAPKLTPDQERVWKALEAALVDGGESCRFLLHGVTGSGKTEIYLRALARALEAGRQAIILVPEISLTPQTIRRFLARFPGRVATIHSELSLGERYDQWRQIRRGELDIVVGPRSAVFAPLPRLGLIVVDEEHEDSYKAGQMPTYHARDVALERARIEGCPIVLGSATPSLESYHRATQGEYLLLELPNRVMGHRRDLEAQCLRLHISMDRQVVHRLGEDYDEACFIDLPAVEVVDLREELRAGNRSIFSRRLQAELQRVLAHKEQAILFLNRRGSATVVSCRDCGYVVQCPRCHSPMTYHSGSDILLCHHCNQRMPSPRSCPVCGSRRIRYLGTGTERVEDAIRDLYPAARLLRWDRDVTGSKGSHQAILDKFAAGEADILVGTQMIAKGLDLPLVTLVGVVLADTELYLPDFRATERTFQLMTQVAGRAGRSMLGGSVVIQTYAPDHYSIQCAARHDFSGFYAQELASRRMLGYPPFSRLAALGYAHKNGRRAQAEAERLAGELRAYFERELQGRASLAGPAPCFFARVRDKYRWQIVVRADDPAEALASFPLPPGWRLDVDPCSLL